VSDWREWLLRQQTKEAEAALDHVDVLETQVAALQLANERMAKGHRGQEEKAH